MSVLLLWLVFLAATEYAINPTTPAGTGRPREKLARNARLQPLLANESK
jgi:hypothetical protein